MTPAQTSAKYKAAKKRLQRNVGQVPTPRGRTGNRDLYARTDLSRWADSAKL